MPKDKIHYSGKQLKDIISDLSRKYPDIQRINIYYYADLCSYPDEFIGVATYHDGFLDTSEDPDGWSLEDDVAWYCEYDKTTVDEVDIHINLGSWDV